MSKVCSQIVLKCLFLARMGRPDILWSVNKLAPSVIKWTGGCDRRLARLISYIHHTSDYRQYCHVGHTAQHCRMGIFQDADFAGDLEDTKSTSGGISRIFESRTFVPISWLCKKQTSVSHSFTESEIISLGAGLRMGWLLALDLWDVVIEVLRSSESTESPNHGAAGNCSRNHKSKAKQKGNRDVDQVSNVDYVTTNANSSQGESYLFIFEDNEAVIKMIIKGRSPTMRHVSRTHRVALDWILDRINLDPKIQIKYVDTKNQLADMLTKGSFGRDEWDHLLRLLNIMNFSFSCSHFLSNRKQCVMSKRAQGSTAKEGSAVAKPRPMSLVSRNLLKAKQTSPKVGSFEQPGESRVGSEFCCMERQETGAR